LACALAACGSKVSIGDGSDDPGSGGAKGTSTTGGVGGTSGAGGAGAESSCEALGGMFNAKSFIAFDSDRDNLRRNLYMIHPDGTGLTQLTTGTNVDREPFFAPDGKRLSFTSNVGGTPQIFVMDVDSRGVVKLTSRPEGADQSSFSRDGQWVAFHSGASVYIINVDGTGERLVATGLNDFNAYQWPAFSADGTQLMFDRNNEIDVTLLDGTGFRYVVHNSTTYIKSPALSPSGVVVAYSVGVCDKVPSIWTSPFTATTGPCQGRRVSPSDGRNAERPTWGSDAWLAYHRVDPKTNLATIAIVGRAGYSVPCILTSGSDDSRNPSWSP
jgi:Tol biopolymer transport system component